MTAIEALGGRFPEALPALLKVGTIAPSLLLAAEDRIAQALYTSREKRDLLAECK